MQWRLVYVFHSDWFILLFDHIFCQFNPTKFYKYKQFNLLGIPLLWTFGSAPAFYFIKICTSSFITEAGEIWNKYRPITDFVRVVSVGACPTPLTVDTPVRFIQILPILLLFSTPKRIEMFYSTNQSHHWKLNQSDYKKQTNQIPHTKKWTTNYSHRNNWLPI